MEVEVLCKRLAVRETSKVQCIYDRVYVAGVSVDECARVCLELSLNNSFSLIFYRCMTLFVLISLNVRSLFLRKQNICGSWKTESLDS